MSLRPGFMPAHWLHQLWRTSLESNRDLVAAKPLHPFPARMASEVVQRRLPSSGRRGRRIARVLDPMSGSGTTIVTARSRGYEAYGVDRDPLAVLIAKASSGDLDTTRFEREAECVLQAARSVVKKLDARSDFPEHCDKDTRDFLRFWFDARARRELLALLLIIERQRPRTAPFIKLAISRMIITKQGGVSLAEDVSHSRPHRTRDLAPYSPFELFPRAVAHIALNARFRIASGLPKATVRGGDCRKLAGFESGFFDYVITSPPYLNAIDYLRGHKLSLIWFGMTVAQVRGLRSSNVGAECGTDDTKWDWVVDAMVRDPEALSNRFRNVIRQYAQDLNEAIQEMARVTRPGGSIAFVVGDCTLRGVEVFNSKGMHAIAKRVGLERSSYSVRPLEQNRRYLPPPSAQTEHGQITKRMWNEVVLGYKVS
jgi:DNA modification methylase